MEQVNKLIKKSDRILITFKDESNIDTICSALALYLYFKKLKKRSNIICNNFITPKKLKFIDQIKEIQNIKDEHSLIININLKNNPLDSLSYNLSDNNLYINLKTKNKTPLSEDIKYLFPQLKYDLIITLNTSDLDDLNLLYERNTEFFFQTPIINIDNKIQNERFGQINLIKLTKTTISEIIYEIIKNEQTNYFDQTLSTILLAGIISKTNHFKNPQINPKLLNTVSELISHKANRELINRHFEQKQTLQNLKIWGKILSNLKYDSTNKIVWSSIDLNQFNTHIKDENIKKLIEELIITAPEAKIVVINYKKSENLFKCAVYTDNLIDSRNLLNKFNSKGTANFAVALLKEKSIHIATEKIISEIRNKIKELPKENII